MSKFKMPDGSVQEFASVDEARAYRAQNFPNFGVGGQSNLARNVPKDIANIISSAGSFRPGSVEQSRMLENAQKMRELTKGASLSSGETEDFNALVDASNTLQELVKFKNVGTKGKGVDTGPIVGGGINLPDWLFGEGARIPFVPASLSPGSDRAEIRRKILSFMNPYRKTITGAQASEKELSKFIAPAVPEESDQDIDFFAKGFGTLSEIERRKRDMLENLRKSGKDITGFENTNQGTPEQVIENLIKELSGTTGKYSLPAVDPERINKILGSEQKTNKPRFKVGPDGIPVRAN